MKTISSFETTIRKAGSHGHLGGDRCPSLRVAPSVGREEGDPSWFPEALLAGALQADVMHLFHRFAEMAHLRVLHYQGSALTQVSSTDAGQQPTAIVLRLWATVEGGAQEMGQARRLLQRTLASSPIARLLKLEPRLELMVDAHPPARDHESLQEPAP